MLDVRTYGGEVQSHLHDYHQFVLPHRGRMEIEVDGHGGAVFAGRGVFIAAGAAHTFLVGASNAFVVIDTTRPPGDAELGFDRSGFFPIAPRLEGLIAHLTPSFAAGEPSSTVRNAWSTIILDGLTSRLPAAEARADLLLDHARGFMRQHLSERISVGDIARAAGTSETRLYALVRSRLGTTPLALLTDLRLAAAERLLLETALPVAEIAVRTGHADQSALTRRLRIVRGTTPAAFRRSATARSPGILRNAECE